MEMMSESCESEDSLSIINFQQWNTDESRRMRILECFDQFRQHEVRRCVCGNDECILDVLIVDHIE